MSPEDDDIKLFACIVMAVCLTLVVLYSLGMIGAVTP